ncbi:MraZ family transcriptional regulator [uncultured Ferrovibrio sp.]|jgi:MraZ protein|uniref:division/cell wall cluster transcriptional repressor MraZ n=1 Tax=uncultured Ferrovibrio sp. TaxID=1576913 RepID=UPI002620B5F4|nr:MraZ family transcriptional regulator [uncultured Ferrovibrio sp.]
MCTDRGGWVEFFLSTFRNRIDAKGRVSVPAPYRALLTKKNAEGGLIMGPDISAPALVAGGRDYLDGINRRIDELPDLHPEREMLIDGLLPFLNELSLDQEGRVQLGAQFLEHAGLSAPGEAVFVGRRNSFQIWEPKAWEARAAEARAKAAAYLRGEGRS